jgi:hypothetical protein
MTLIELLKMTPIYQSLLEQVPEADRPAAIAALAEQLKPYEHLCAGLPGDAMGKFASSLNKAGVDTTPKQPGRRQPRRF